MIAIQIQGEHQTVEVLNFWINPAEKPILRANAASVIFNENGNFLWTSSFIDLGEYENIIQAEHVYNQINQAIENEKRLFRMPSPEEAEKMIHENKTIEEAQPEEGLKINPVIKNLLASIAPSKKSPAAEPAITYAEQTWGRPLTGPECENIIQNMNALIALGCQDPNSIIKEAFKQADLQGVRTMKYIDSILRDWQKRKFITLTQIQKADERFKEIKDKSKPKVVDPGKYDDIYIT